MNRKSLFLWLFGCGAILTAHCSSIFSLPFLRIALLQLNRARHIDRSANYQGMWRRSARW